MPGQLLAELAASVLEQRSIVLAQEILGGGAHRLRAAIELAALLLADQATEGATEKASC